MICPTLGDWFIRYKQMKLWFWMLFWNGSDIKNMKEGLSTNVYHISLNFISLLLVLTQNISTFTLSNVAIILSIWASDNLSFIPYWSHNGFLILTFNGLLFLSKFICQKPPIIDGGHGYIDWFIAWFLILKIPLDRWLVFDHTKFLAMWLYGIDHLWDISGILLFENRPNFVKAPEIIEFNSN